MLAPPVSSLPPPRWARGPLSVPCRLDTPTYKLHVKTRSGACTHMLPCFLQHRILRPSRGGLRAATCPAAPRPAFQPRWAPTSPRVPWLQTRGEGSGAPCVLRFWILPLCRESFGLPHILQPSVGRGPHTLRSGACTHAPPHFLQHGILPPS
jgi:hypothetical protein